MKTPVNFLGGLVTGLLLFSLTTSSFRQADTNADPAYQMSSMIPSGSLSAPPPQRVKFVEVPLQNFVQDVARYYQTHAQTIQAKMPTGGHIIPGTVVKRKSNEQASRMFLYSVSVLEQFFAEIKKLAATADITPEELGIRFYYGVYPQDQTIAKENYGSLHTLLMMPNYWSREDKRYRDIDVKGLAQAVKKAKDNGTWSNNVKQQIIKDSFLENVYAANPLKKILLLDASTVQYEGDFPVVKASVFSLFAPTPPAPPIINQGQLCPPACPTASFLDFVDGKYPGGLPY